MNMDEQIRLIAKLIKAGHSVKSTLFRSNYGTGWTGKRIKRVKAQQQITVNKGDIIITQGRPFTSGLPAGFHELFGWTEIRITDDMVGKCLPVFTSVRVDDDRADAAVNGASMVSAVRSAGGISLSAKSPEQLKQAIKNIQL